MFKKLFILVFLLSFLFIGQVYAPTITELEGITGKIGKEDIEWGTGEAADTFTVPTYDGGVVTLIKLPDIWQYLGTIRPKDVITRGPWIDSRSYTTLALANTAAVTASKTLLITQNYTLTGANTLTAAVIVVKGGSFTHSAGSTLTINGSFESGLYQVFSGFDAGDVTFGAGSVKEVYPEWWGIDGTADDVQINCAIASIGTSKGKVSLQAKTYQTVAAIANTVAAITIEGKGIGATIINATGCNGFTNSIYPYSISRSISCSFYYNMKP